jgi:hypothetical protein
VGLPKLKWEVGWGEWTGECGKGVRPAGAEGQGRGRWIWGGDVGSS